MMRLRMMLAAVSLVGLVAAGCSDDSDDANDETTTTTEATTTTTEATDESSTTTETTTTTEAPNTTEADEPVDEFARLSGLPWASPDDAHEDPVAAVEAYLGWVGVVYSGGFGDVVVGEFAAGDQRSGEVEVSFTDEASTGSATTTPTITVFVRQAGPGDSWWVLGSQSSTLTLIEPEADAVIGSPLELTGENMVISDAVQLNIYAEGVDGPLVETLLTGGGIFATGGFGIASECMTFDDQPCDPAGPPGGAGTVMIISSYGATTVPVVFADT